METVRFGYELPFREIPPPSHEPTNRSAREDLTFVRAEVERLEKLGCILRVEKKPPDTRILFLGLEICSKTMKFYIPEKKLHFILSVTLFAPVEKSSSEDCKLSWISTKLCQGTWQGCAADG